jgi:hypothetical protein
VPTRNIYLKIERLISYTAHGDGPGHQRERTARLLHAVHHR